MKLVREIISEFKESLRSLYSIDERDQIILYAFEHTCKFSRPDLILNDSLELPDEQSRELDRILKSLLEGKPIQYILGYGWFMDRQFLVSSAVLIPRQETEELLRWLIEDHRKDKDKKLNALDLCTGSGIIAISLSLNFPQWNVQAVDISEEALKVAEENNRRLGSMVSFFESDFLKWRSDKKLHQQLNDDSSNTPGLDIIVSNPPYVLEKERTEMHPRVFDHEPSIALFVPDKDPLIFYKEIAAFATKSLRPGGKVYVEINRAYAGDIINLFSNKKFSNITLRKDILDNDRMISATFTSH